MNATSEKESAFKIVSNQLAEAVAAPKCHKCGCLHKTVEALSGTEAGKNELAPILTEARSVFVPKQYDCLACPVCYPAIAANAFVEAYLEVGDGLNLCPTEEPDARPGWPPLPGDFYVVRYGAPVAVCTLNSEALAVQRSSGHLAVLAWSTAKVGGAMILRTSWEVNRNEWGVRERALKLHACRKGLLGIARAKTGIGKSDLPEL